MLDTALEHHRRGKLKEAEQIYQQILAVHPNHPDCLNLLGTIAYQVGNLEVAADLIGRAIGFYPKGTDYYVNLGNVLQAQGKLGQAETLYRHALQIKPHLMEAHVNLANVLMAQGRLDESVACFESALDLNCENAETHNNLGNALQTQGKLEGAVHHYELAAYLRPDYAEAYYNMGNARRAQQELDLAISCYQHALEIRPGYPEAHYNMGNTLREQGKVDEALAQFAIALSLRSDYAQAGFGESLAQLLQGRFDVGWRNYERRWQSIDHDTPKRSYQEPAWAGNRLESGSLLIWGEQGVGDEIMFAGLIPDVLRTNNRCVLDCDARLRPLFARSFPSLTVVSGCHPGTHPELEIASHLPSGSLPGLFRRTDLDFGAPTRAYLVADQANRDSLHTRYGDGRPLVGLAWHTNNRKTGRFRSIGLPLLAPLFTDPELRWISLQYGDSGQLEDQAASAGLSILVDRDVDQLSDMDLFAAQIAAMDLVITVDNSTAHLAGALGVPVWVLLPFAPDWRWLLQREDCPWYPTMRLFRQTKPGDWLSVVEKVKQALAGWKPDLSPRYQEPLATRNSRQELPRRCLVR
jgi:tetratricopeptide (TPR) repeat protein